jgi:hypothetical protein
MLRGLLDVEAMPKPYFLAVVLALLAIPALPLAAGAVTVQQDPVAGQPLDPNYGEQAEQERRDQVRREQDARRADDPCELGCGDYEGLQTRGVPDTPFVAVLHKTELDDGVMTVRLRFYNEGSEPARLTIDPMSASETYFVEVSGEKLFILKDEGGELETKGRLEIDLKPGKMESWWAKFPAPPADADRFDLEIPPVATFRDIRVEDD